MHAAEAAKRVSHEALVIHSNPLMLGGKQTKMKGLGRNAKTAKAVTPVSTRAARISFTAAATFLILLAALHVIKPEYDPSWHFVSEYAIGDYGWVMMVAFFSLALSCVTLIIAIRSQVPTI